MANAAYAIVGRVRKAHGLHGEVVVEPITGTPDVIYAPGGQVVPGAPDGTPLPDVQPLTVRETRPFKEGLLVGFAGIRDRTEAETLRGLYLLAPFESLAPLAEGEVYLHDLVGVSVRHVDGSPIGDVIEVYELPQGVVLDVRRQGTSDTVMIPYRTEVVREVDMTARVIVVDPPPGLLDSMLRVTVITIFPEYFTQPLGLSIPARAAAAGSAEYRMVHLRDFTHDRHRTVDDYAYGGGPGMVMKPEPFFEAVEACGVRAPIVLLSARGRRFTQADAVRYAAGEELTLLCGHYKDVDQRVADFLATEELSLGDFVVSGGEAAAVAVIDATVRLLPGAMSDQDSAYGDSFFNRGLSAPSYTRPPEYRGHVVPPVLLSGDHAKIAAWRQEEAVRLTRQPAPTQDPGFPLSRG